MSGAGTRKTAAVCEIPSGPFDINPAVVGSPHFRFYAGTPVIDSDGFAAGALCVIDQSRGLSACMNEMPADADVGLFRKTNARAAARQPAP
jgi:hypothetical protein